MRKYTEFQRNQTKSALHLDHLATAASFRQKNSAGHASASCRQRKQGFSTATLTKGIPSAPPENCCLSERLSTHLHRHVVRLGLCFSLSVSILGTGCVPIQSIREDAANLPNPMFNTEDTEEANIAFVTESQKAMTFGSGEVNFGSESASRRTRETARWIVRTKDNLNLPFAIVDKINAKVYVFGADGQLYGAAPVLLGIAKGDHSIPDIGNKPLSQIPLKYRTTPAGRFVSHMGRNHKGADILWLDYNQALSMHAVVKGRPQDRRAERLATPSPLDNRISFGCINVPVKFYENMISSKFSGQGGIVYIMPETKSDGKHHPPNASNTQ